MHYLLLDTCVLLDISTKKNDLPIVAALEKLVSSDDIILVIPDIVKAEYDRNKERVAGKIRQRLAHEFKQVKSVVDKFGGENKGLAIDVLNSVNSRLPILTDANYTTISRIEQLIASAKLVPVSAKAKIEAVQRGLDKRAPFHLSKNSIADAVIIEQFNEFVTDNQSADNHFIFVTHNHNDFSSKDHRLPHEDFQEIFNDDNVHYFNNSASAINLVDEGVLNETQYEHDVTEETRDLQEILTVMDELVDKVWYNRHCNSAYGIEQGDIALVPEGTERYGNDVMHEHIWAGALKSAKRVKDQYDDTGPWDDFEWGMINGKLSALRWVLGDDWDMLDT